MSRRVVVPLPAGMEPLHSEGMRKADARRRCGWKCTGCGEELRAVGTLYQAIGSFEAHRRAGCAAVTA